MLAAILPICILKIPFPYISNIFQSEIPKNGMCIPLIKFRILMRNKGVFNTLILYLQKQR